MKNSSHLDIETLTQKIENIGYEKFLKLVDNTKLFKIIFLFDAKTQAKLYDVMRKKIEVDFKAIEFISKNSSDEEHNSIVQTLLQQFQPQRTSTIHLKVRLDEGMFWKIVVTGVLALFNFVLYQDISYFLDAGYYWAFLITLPFVYLIYILFRVSLIAREIDIYADINSLCWFIFENDKLIESEYIQKRDIQEFKIDLHVASRYVSSAYIFTLKNETTKQLKDDFLYSFECDYEDIKSFLSMWYEK